LVEKRNFVRYREIRDHLKAMEDFSARSRARAIFAWITWHKEDGSSISVSASLEDLGEYVVSRNGRAFIEWPKWVYCLLDHGKVKLEFKTKE